MGFIDDIRMNRYVRQGATPEEAEAMAHERSAEDEMNWGSPQAAEMYRNKAKSIRALAALKGVQGDIDSRGPEPRPARRQYPRRV